MAWLWLLSICVIQLYNLQIIIISYYIYNIKLAGESKQFFNTNISNSLNHYNWVSSVKKYLVINQLTAKAKYIIKDLHFFRANSLSCISVFLSFAFVFYVYVFVNVTQLASQISFLHSFDLSRILSILTLLEMKLCLAIVYFMKKSLYIPSLLCYFYYKTIECHVAPV